jgi:hypothetical protein
MTQVRVRKFGLSSPCAGFPSLITGQEQTLQGPSEDRQRVDTRRTVPICRLHDTTGEDLGTLEHPAPNLEPGDVVVRGRRL